MTRRSALRLTAGALVFLVAALLVPLALGATFQALFRAWNIHADNVARAPLWAQWVYAWHGSFITLVSGGLLAAGCLWLFHIRIAPPNAQDGLWGLVGLGIPLLMIILFTLTDSLRPEGPPYFSPGLIPLGGLMLVSLLGEELLTKGVVYDTVLARWGRTAATLAATLAFFLIGGGLGGTVISGVNVALTGLLCGWLYSHGGIWAPVLFRWGWGFATVFLLGQGGGGYAVRRFYGVSETLLTGGDAGFACGLMWTCILIALNVAESGAASKLSKLRFSTLNIKPKKG